MLSHPPNSQVSTPMISALGLRIRPTSLKGRIVTFFVALLLVIQLAGALAIRFTIEQSARAAVADDLEVGRWVAGRLYEDAVKESQPPEVMVTQFRWLTGLHVSLLRHADGAPPVLLASTLDETGRNTVLKMFPALLAKPEQPVPVQIAGHEFWVFPHVVKRTDNSQVIAALQRSIDDGLRPFRVLEWVLIVLSLAGLLLTLMAGVTIARKVTQPVSTLALAARRIANGSYDEQLSVKAADEIDDLALAFNQMTRGLKERDQVRDLLGKVTSRAVANQLLAQQIELGGEEREVTVMFADIRNFTSLCEVLSPHASMRLLNRYLETITATIEEHDGVIDKYIGDGVMAIFGAPVTNTDDAGQAVRVALSIERRITYLARELADENLPNPTVGIGINTARVLAGNIGTATRLNYTVLGDGVNLAARLEGLTKRYQVPIVVGERTAEMVSSLVYLELDKVRVKGKLHPVRIFRPLGERARLDPVTLTNVERHHTAMGLYRSRNWDAAAALFQEQLGVPELKRIAELYLGYIRDCLVREPDPNWDGAFTLYEK